VFHRLNPTLCFAFAALAIRARGWRASRFGRAFGLVLLQVLVGVGMCCAPIGSRHWRSRRRRDRDRAHRA
jgi:hypothetical protein